MIQNAVLELMIEQGGSFNRKLAELYYVADSENSKKLELAFSDIFERFKKLSGETSDHYDEDEWDTVGYRATKNANMP